MYCISYLTPITQALSLGLDNTEMSIIIIITLLQLGKASNMNINNNLNADALHQKYGTIVILWCKVDKDLLATKSSQTNLASAEKNQKLGNIKL